MKLESSKFSNYKFGAQDLQQSKKKWSGLGASWNRILASEERQFCEINN